MKPISIDKGLFGDWKFDITSVYINFWKSKNIEEIGPINLGAVFRDTNEAR